ncbi:acetyl-CoA C-acyltransferase [Malaciobacter mytili LMG 24559]|uniref:Acetyl-CoA C-acyltransferase n=1 Tax=Malaciobacter mytili LMG 24559 TaxID=1032238 RepID=A0AAX2AJQ1_9BACT|nr:thiolase family protein [Malaciobacter mytili]AXH14789.1 3-ketoacyl-CoA thiolase [Malaciobacter mytili LMG 24559]RXK16840.1 acetyl-CoA C-acyltransferase [Malaciobacter mytili LMG 24559]
MEKIVVIDGLRSPIAKAYGKLNNIQAEELGSIIAKELVLRSGIDYKEFDEVIIGNVAQPTHAANIARVIAIKAGFPISTPAYTVHRNCASGMQSISSAIEKIHSKQGELYLVGGVESMSNIPLLHTQAFKNILTEISNTKSIKEKLKILTKLKLQDLKPVIGLISGLTDPISGKIMGKTAENLANEFKIDRQTQDLYALNSHLKAQKAIENKIFEEEIHPIISKNGSIFEDDGVRLNQTLEALGKLRTIFDANGTVTAGNSSQVSDGASMLIICSESKAKELNLEPLGYIKDYAYAGLEPDKMGLGPLYATHKLFNRSKITLKDIDLIELNEAFASQVLANLEAFKSIEFANKHFEGKVLGEINNEILNVNGGAIALGHPVGMSGTRIVLHLLKELKRRNLKTGLATLCVGGGQGASFLLEV